jgi:Ca-activated chloride channel family protein
MRQVFVLLLLIISVNHLNAQYYLRGQVKDEKGKLLSNVRLMLHSSPSNAYYSGSTGAFGVPSSVPVDTITLVYDGYEVLKKAVETQKYQVLEMKMLAATASLMKNKLSSITKDMLHHNNMFATQGESYSSLIENEVVDAVKYPETGFALNIDRAAYSNIRRFINNEIRIPTDAVRIEEMLNYFSFECPDAVEAKKANRQKFNTSSYVTECPWDAAKQLFFINITAPKLNLENIPPSNLVFLIDISGSMDKPNRLPLLQSAFKMLTENLREQDTVSIVTYGGGVAIPLLPTSGADKRRIIDVIDSLTASGDTPGEGAIHTAYSTAKRSFIEGGNNRVILATDGDFNVGQASEKQLEDIIGSYRNTGIYLSCLGVGMGNYKDSKLEALAKKGNGNFAYIDNLKEAEKVLVTEFTKTLYAVATDAYLNIRFNPHLVKDYRLIGFDNKKVSVQDSTSELEGGEVGSGHSMMAIFEITPQPTTQFDLNIVANATLQYKKPNNDTTVHYQRFSFPYKVQALSDAPPALRFATAVSMFGTMLKQSKYVKGYTFEDVINMARSGLSGKDYAQQEFITLVEKADELYNPGKKKKKKKKKRDEE